MSRRIRRRYRKQFALETWQILLLALGTFLITTSYSLLSSLEDISNALLVALMILAIVSVVIFVAIIALEKRKYSLKKAITQSQVDRMSGIEFENYIADLLKFQGYKVRSTPPSNDFGVDLIASKEKITFSIQIKRYGPRNKVDRTAVSDAVAGIKHYRADQAMVITNSFYTKSAKYMAKTTRTTLVDRAKLSEWILEFQNT